MDRLVSVDSGQNFERNALINHQPFTRNASLAYIVVPKYIEKYTHVSENVLSCSIYIGDHYNGHHLLSVPPSPFSHADAGDWRARVSVCPTEGEGPYIDGSCEC